jgi:hypothetical protein
MANHVDIHGRTFPVENSAQREIARLGAGEFEPDLRPPSMKTSGPGWETPETGASISRKAGPARQPCFLLATLCFAILLKCILLTRADRPRRVTRDVRAAHFRLDHRGGPAVARGGGLPAAEYGASANDGVLRGVELPARTSEAGLPVDHGTYGQLANDAAIDRFPHRAVFDA